MNKEEQNQSSQKTISGFSKLSKRGKIGWIVENFFKDPEAVMRELISYWHSNEEHQKIIDGFSENTISNFTLPYGVAPNFVINGQTYCIPMVTEESSVVAAAASAAKFWMKRGGFHSEVVDVQKVGQIHFSWNGDPQKLKAHFSEIEEAMLTGAELITRNMKKRGGGVRSISLFDYTDKEEGYYQIRVTFDTKDSMGANFINSVLESFSETLETFIADHHGFEEEDQDVDVIMSILSNYTPNCLVRAWVECPIEELGNFDKGISAADFANRFCKAIRIARIDPYRATTHNKGIFNGIDAIVIATGNDFRAIEAAGHSFAARNGQYASLTNCEIENGIFRFWLEIPLAVGTVGGATSLHPMAKRSLELLEHPDAKELMTIIAATGLAQNFAAVRSLVTSGIQKGHMRMHLHNILTQLMATEEESRQAKIYFEDRTISFTAVREFLTLHRSSTDNKVPVKS